MDAIKQANLSVFHVLCVSLVFGIIALNTNAWMKATDPSEFKVTPHIDDNYFDESLKRMKYRSDGRNNYDSEERMRERFEDTVRDKDEKAKYYSDKRIRVVTHNYTGADYHRDGRVGFNKHSKSSSIREPLLWWQHCTAGFLYAALFLSTVHVILLMVLLTRPDSPNIMLLANVVLCGLIFLCYLCALMFFGIGLACVRNEARELRNKLTPEKIVEEQRDLLKRAIERFEAAPGMSYWMMMYAMLAALGATLTAGSAFMSNKDAAN